MKKQWIKFLKEYKNPKDDKVFTKDLAIEVEEETL